MDIYKGWEEIEFEPLEHVTGDLPKAYKNTMSDFGFVTFPDDQVLIALDGQHRLLSLKIAIKGLMGIPAGYEIKQVGRRRYIHIRSSRKKRLV